LVGATKRTLLAGCLQAAQSGRDRDCSLVPYLGPPDRFKRPRLRMSILFCTLEILFACGSGPALGERLPARSPRLPQIGACGAAEIRIESGIPPRCFVTPPSRNRIRSAGTGLSAVRSARLHVCLDSRRGLQWKSSSGVRSTPSGWWATARVAFDDCAASAS